MGLTNESQGGGNWLKVIAGEIRKEVPQGTAGAVERTKKNGVIVYELKYNALEGVLKKIFVSKAKVEEYGDQWCFVINDGVAEYVLGLGWESSVARGFLGRLPNVNLERPLKILTYNIEDKEEKGKFKQFLGITQDGQKIESYFTKDERHGLPEWEQVQVGNKKVWDSSKEMNFFLKMVDDKVNPKLKELYPIDHVETERESEEEPPLPTLEDVSDLPF